MKLKKYKIILHQHDIKDFISDRYAFYQKYYLEEKPKHYTYKGVENAFVVGTAIDFAIKEFYLSGSTQHILSKNKSFHSLKKLDKVIASTLVNGYISKYHSYKDTKEYFHDFKEEFWKVPVSFRGLKNKYFIHCSPDLTAYNLLNEFYIIEIKTTYSEDVIGETLDFQTMCYCWASYKWDFKIPKGVIKRTIAKPRIKQNKKETESEFIKRLVTHVAENEDKYFKFNYREVNLNMIKEFEKYLHEIIKDMDSCWKKKYKYYKNPEDYWGNETLS